MTETTPNPGVGDLIGPHLAALIAADGTPLTAAITLANKPTPRSRRVSFRLEFADGRVAKGRRVGNPAQADRMLCLSQQLHHLPIARVLARHGDALLEEWIDGTPLSDLSITPAACEQAGELLGRLAATVVKEPPNATRVAAIDTRLEQLTQHLDALHDAGLIDAETTRRLPQLARANAPQRLDIGIGHHDFHPTNLVLSNTGLHAIDPELLNIDALDADLARCCYRWSMSDAERAAFITGYQRHRNAQAFIHHELFWAITTIAAAARYHQRIERSDPALPAALRALGAGRLPSPWLRPTVPTPPGGRRIRLAVIADYLAVGGQERVILNLLKGLDRERFEPHAYAFRGGMLAPAITGLGIPLTLGSARDPLYWRDGCAQENAREIEAWRGQLARALRDDDIEAAIIFAWADGVGAAREAGVPVLIERLDGPNLLAKVPSKAAFDKLVCESATLRTGLLQRLDELELAGDRIELIYSGIDLDRFDPGRFDRGAERRRLGLRDDEVVIGYIGRLDPGKNIELLMQGVAALSSDPSRPPSRLLIMGPDDGSLSALQALQRRDHRLHDRVLFVAPSEDVTPILAALDIFAMTSNSEGVPNAILEAMAMGLPIVSTGVGSIHEVIGDNGLLIDTPTTTAVTHCLQRLVEDPDLRAAMARSSFSVSRRFGLPTTIGRYEDLIEDTLGQHCKARSGDDSALPPYSTARHGR